MIRVWCDFNAGTPDGFYFILYCNHKKLGEQSEALRITSGTKVILYQDDDDFEVVAALDFRYIGLLQREEWVARPDWSTFVRKADVGSIP